MNKDQFINRVMYLGNIQDKHVAEQGLKIIFGILSHRLQEEGAKDVESQLPEELKKHWTQDVWVSSFYKLSGKRLNFRHMSQMMSLIENEIKRDNLPLHAESLTRAVFHTLKEQISPGETADIVAQLPEEIKEYFKAA